MTRKHFNRIAARIATQRAAIDRLQDSEARVILRHLAEELADDFQYFNGAFDRGRFLRTCGVQE